MFQFAPDQIKPVHRPNDPKPDAPVQTEVGAAAFRALMRLETAIRQSTAVHELHFLIANEARALLRARQIFVVKQDRTTVRIATISGLPNIDRGAPFIQQLEDALSRFAAQSGLTERREFRLSALAAETVNATLVSYPLQEMLWVPLKYTSGGLVVARDTPWRDADIGIAEHIADAAGYAERAIANRAVDRDRSWLTSSRLAFAALAVAALGFIPVRMTVLAPLEIVAREPFVVSSGLDGIVETILVQPNQKVTEGASVARLVSIDFRNKLEVAEREVQVAVAKVQKAKQLAFSDARGRHDMGVTQAEYELRVAERNFARDQLDKTDLKAGRAGIAVYGDRKDIVGRPVSVGDRIMEIADPDKVEVQIDIGLGDAIVVKSGADVKLFLDSSPLSPVSATIARADYKARSRDGGPLAYRAVAAFNDLPASGAPRLGVRGTAQVYGERVALWFFLLRRPISAARQWVGL